MEKELTMDLFLLAEVLKENNAKHLIGEIAKKDYQVAQVLDVLIIEIEGPLKGPWDLKSF